MQAQADNRAAKVSGTPLDLTNIISGDYYQKNGYPHTEWTYLRKHQPVAYIEHPRTDPFWAVTKAADIMEISKQPRLWLNGPRLAVFLLEEGEEALPPEALPLKHLLNMDPPEHAEYRAILSRYFTPRSVRALEPEVSNITTQVFDDVMDRAECDFVTEISSRVPVAVIAEMLGVPRADWPRLFRWTNEIIGGGDPEFQRGENPTDTFAQARLEVFEYFSNLVAERQKQPANDVTSIVANAKINGAPLPMLELLSYPAGAGSRRQRDDPQRDHRRPIGTDRTSRSVPPPQAGAGNPQASRRGNRAMDLPGHSVLAYRDSGHHGSRAENSSGGGGVPVLSIGESRRRRV
jgi:cytochrome P450